MVTVLVVDDDPAIGRLLELILSSADIEVERAQTGEAALVRLTGGLEPDLILLDIMMPGMDGREVFRAAREAGVTSPILFCSAHGAEAANTELGGQGAIEKPFNPDRLIATIEALVRNGST